MSSPAASIDPKQIRERLGWSQAQMAAHLGVSQPTVSRIERGESPNDGPIRRLLEILDSDPTGPRDPGGSPSGGAPTSPGSSPEGNLPEATE